jgi:integrase
VANRWQHANRPRNDGRTGEWVGWSPKTAKTHADNFRLYILPSLGHRDAATVTGLQLDDLYGYLEDERGLSASVAKRCHSQISAMYNWAVRKKLVIANPALAADPPRVKPGQLRVPTMADVRATMALADPSFAVYVQLAATVGSRRGSMVALRWGNVDLGGGYVTFERAIAESLQGQIEKGTKADRPYVASLGPSSVAALTEHRARAIAAAGAVGVAFGERSFVFSDDGGATHWNLSWPSHAWKKYAGKAGLDVRLHDLRHTAASQMLMAGVPISIVAERLGCTETNILRTYRHFIPGSDRSAAELMDRMLEGGEDVLAAG